MIKIINDNGRPWAVRVVQLGDYYGLNFCIYHEDFEPVVEFYDARYEHTQYGQFVSRYNLTTILEHTPEHGLDLHGGVPSWKISAEAMQRVTEWLISNLNEMRLQRVGGRPVLKVGQCANKPRKIVLCPWRGQFVTWQYYPVEQFELGQFHDDVREALRDYEKRLAG